MMTAIICCHDRCSQAEAVQNWLISTIKLKPGPGMQIITKLCFPAEFPRCSAAVWTRAPLFDVPNIFVVIMGKFGFPNKICQINVRTRKKMGNYVILIFI